MNLVLDGLTKRFGSVLALDGISFEVERGQVFGFLGANGAGKTTTIDRGKIAVHSVTGRGSGCVDGTSGGGG